MLRSRTLMSLAVVVTASSIAVTPVGTAAGDEEDCGYGDGTESRLSSPPRAHQLRLLASPARGSRNSR